MFALGIGKVKHINWLVLRQDAEWLAFEMEATSSYQSFCMFAG